MSEHEIKTTGLKPGDTIKIVRAPHPWLGERGELVVFEEYGLGWRGWRVALDNGTECYADAVKLRKVP